MRAVSLMLSVSVMTLAAETHMHVKVLVRIFLISFSQPSKDDIPGQVVIGDGDSYQRHGDSFGVQAQGGKWWVDKLASTRGGGQTYISQR